MADKPTPTPEVSEEQADAPASRGLHERVTAVLNWARASKLRMALVGSVAITVLGGVFAVWSYLAHLAVNTEDPANLEMALAALDNREIEEAKNLIGKMKRQKQDPDHFGGALFVLGAVKAFQAEDEWSAARQRALYLVAARYLQKARVLEVPADREAQLVFLLGKSLIRGNQPREGILVLNEALLRKDLSATRIHALLVG